MSEWWVTAPQLTPRQRDVQAAHHRGFWDGFARGILIANAIGLPLFAVFLVWWFTR